jgi:hypothetical protein
MAFGDNTCKDVEMRHLLAALADIVPMSKSHAAAIDSLLQWSANNAISVSKPEEANTATTSNSGRVIRARRV